MDITEDGIQKDIEESDEKKEADLFGGAFSDFLNNIDFNNSATVKKDDATKLKIIKQNQNFEKLESDFHSKTELNKKNDNKNLEKKEEDKFQFILISKKKQRENNQPKIKKKQLETNSIKNKTELNDYQSKKKKIKETFDNIYNYYNNDNEDLENMYDIPQATDGLLNTMNDFEFDINQKKQAYTSQLNDETSNPLDMFISSEVNN